METAPLNQLPYDVWSYLATSLISDSQLHTLLPLNSAFLHAGLDSLFHSTELNFGDKDELSVRRLM